MPVANNAMIAVMGGTGTGKSSFIQILTGDQGICIGHGQESQTDQVETSVYIDPISNCSVVLVDTPGFDDSRHGISDTDILQRIVYFLQSNGGRKLNGVVYLYRISDPRMGGNAKKNLRMFRELCGESALKNVCIATTNWGRVTQEEGDMRERELRESPNLFKPLLDAGARLVRHDKGAASAQSIVDYLIRKYPTKLQIQAELDEGKRLDDTGAGSVLNEEIKAFMEKHEASMQALRMEMEEAEDAELLAELEEERQTKEQQLLKMKKDLHELNKQQLIEVGGGIPILFIAYWKWIAAHAKWILAGSFIVLVLVMVLAYWHEDSSLSFGSASICGTRIEHSFGLGLEVEVIISVTC